MKAQSHFLIAGTFFLFSLAGFFACTHETILPEGSIIDNGGDGGDPTECPPGVVSFQYEVLPLLVSSCALSDCHDAASHKEGVILNSFDKIRKEVKPGKPNSSKLYEVLFESGDERMPPSPNSPLTNDQKNLIRNWIEQGAQNTNCGIPCDPSMSSFTADIFPIIQSTCLGCHSGSTPQGGINLSDYTRIRTYALNGRLMGAIQHKSGYKAMPPSGNPLSNCRISQIGKWIGEGAPNN